MATSGANVARKINPIFKGVQMGDVRPGAYATDLDMSLVAGDQANLYETLTDQPVPGAAAVTSNYPHDHTGKDPSLQYDSGALIRHSYVTQWLDASLPPREENETNAHPLFLPFYWSPVYVPRGTDCLLIGMGCGENENSTLRLARFLVRIYSISGATYTEVASGPYRFDRASLSSEFWVSNSSDSGYRFIQCRITPDLIDFKSGGYYLVRIDAWDGANFNLWNDSQDGDIIEYNRVSTVIIAPIKQKPPAAVYQWTEPQLPTDNIDTPAEFQPIETDFVDVDRSINSAVLTSCSRNDSLLYEVTTGRPAGNKSEAALTHNGHNHADWLPGSTPARGGTTGLDDVGRDISFNLGSWFYGVLRPPAMQWNNSHFSDIDCAYDGGVAAPVTPGVRSVWGGRIVAPMLRSTAVPPTSSGVWGTVSNHIFRLPANTDINIGLSGAASKISAVALMWNDDASSTADVELTLYDKDGLNPGASVTVSTNAIGRSVLSFANLECSTNATGAGDIQRLGVRMRKSRNQARVAIYGVSLAYGV